MNLSKLGRLWKQEAGKYRIYELGDGTQGFVKYILESEELLNLKNSKLSTPEHLRKNEFRYEKNANSEGRADFVIYIDQDIHIPVEVEKLGNIKAGEHQILKYQKGLDLRYGILTDTQEWRFYNNNIYRVFTLEQILKQPGLFLTFWQEYVQKEDYYLDYFEGKGQLALSGETTLPIEDYRETFFEDITWLIGKFRNKIKLEGYLEEIAGKTKEQRAVELTYAYIIQFILYKTLVDNHFGDYQSQFERFVEEIGQDLGNGRYRNILTVTNVITKLIAKNVYRPFTDEQSFIEEKIQDLLARTKNEIADVAPWLDLFVFIKKYNFANVKNDIFGFIYENYLKELYQDSQKGQYFTDPAVVNFMLKEIGFTPDELQKRYKNDLTSLSIIDPACGSGTFLYSATDIVVQAFHDGYHEEASQLIEEIVTKNIFGLDIEEFPLYLAEMSILMRLLPLIINKKYNNPIDKKIKVFKTRDSIAEFMDTALRNTLTDSNIAFHKAAGKNQIALFAEKLDLGYPSYVRNEDDLNEMKKSLENSPKIPRQRFDFVIGNPPYIGYNQASKDKALFVQLIQAGKMQMNDIYGMNLNTVPGLHKAYAPKPNVYAFFIALGLSLLKDNGKLCFIIPQTILTSTDLDVIRFHLSKYYHIEKIITFSSKVFLGRGIQQNSPVDTSSLIITVVKSKPTLDTFVNVWNSSANSSDISKIFSDIQSGKYLATKKIRQSELANKITNWNFIKFSPKITRFVKDYVSKTDSVDIYRDPVQTKQRGLSHFYFDKGLVFPKNKVKVDVNFKDSFIVPKITEKHFLIDKGGSILSRSDIILPKGSQGLDVYTKKYKIIWSYMNHKIFHFTDLPVMINFNWVLISSDEQAEMIYLLALLNSKLTTNIINLYVKSSGEKDLLLGIKTIKSLFKVPKITKLNQGIKDLVIKLTEEMLDLERVTLGDLIDFSGIMVQEFDKVKVVGNELMLRSGKREMKAKITGSLKLITEIEFDKDKLSLQELKTLRVIDKVKQKEIKAHIDDLVYALYFGVKIDGEKIGNSGYVRAQCEKHEFYKLINKDKDE